MVKQKRFYPYEYMSVFEKFKEQLPSKEKFYSSLIDKKKISEKEYEHVLKVWSKFWNENNETLSHFVFKIWRFTVRKWFLKI